MEATFSGLWPDESFMMKGMETLAAAPVISLADEAAYARSPEQADLNPEVYARKLLQLPEHAHLSEGEAIIEWLLKRDEKVKGGRRVLGTAHLPRVQGELNPCFEWLLERYFERMPDFLIILDRQWWFGASLLQREILCHHELSHCVHKEGKDGEPLYDENDRPRWGIVDHDVNEFTSVVRRYGAWNEDLRQFVAAANLHGK
jgi:hypothetical protein